MFWFFLQGRGGGDGEIKGIENTSTYTGFYTLKVTVVIMESTMMGSIRGCICLRRMIVTKGLFLLITSKLLGLFGTIQCC